MIPKLPGWVLVEEGDATCVQARPGAVLRYVERVRPLATMQEIATAALGDEHVLEIGEIEQLVTREGEDAAIVHAVVEREGAAVTRSLGVVFGDDFYSLVDALGADRGAIELAVSHDGLGLGVRRRRARHAAPAGWAHARRGLADSYERDGARIRVFPATPRCSSVDEALAALVDDLRASGFDLGAPAVEPVAFTGLDGVCIEVAAARDGLATRHALAVVDDGTYLYVVREDGRSDAYSFGAFVEVLRSLEAISQRRERAAADAAFEHWAV